MNFSGGASGNNYLGIGTSTTNAIRLKGEEVLFGSTLYHLTATFDSSASFAQVSVPFSANSKTISNYEGPNLNFSQTARISLNVDVNGNQGPVWIDNIKITSVSPRPTQKFGLFVGVDDSQGTEYTFKGGLQSRRLVTAFNSRENHYGESISLNLSESQGSRITIQSIAAGLARLKDQGLQSGDTIVLSVSGHGGSTLPVYGKGVDIIALGGEKTEFLKDHELAELVRAFDPKGDYKWDIFVNSCNAGGMWGEDIFEKLDSEGAVHLSDLSNVSLFAASREGEFTYFNQANGLSLFGMALEDAFNSGWLDNYEPVDFLNLLQARATRTAEQLAFEDPDFRLYEAKFGDSILASDYRSNFVLLGATTASVPLPSTGSLVLLAIATLASTRRKFN
jgi:hypothetical protein